MNITVPNGISRPNQLTNLTISSSISGFTLASVTSWKILTQGIVLTRRCSTLVYICIQNKKPEKKPLILDKDNIGLSSCRDFRQQFKSSYRFSYKEHKVLYQGSHIYHFRTVQSIQDDRNTTFNCAFLEYDPVREMNPIYGTKRRFLILQGSLPVSQFLSAQPR